MRLNNVTFVVIDRVAHKLTKLALDESLRHCTPDDIVVFTDKPEIINAKGARVYEVRPGDMESYNKILYHMVPAAVCTTHFLTIEWDGWIVNPEAWRKDFLYYDYIGAPWPHHPNDGNRVGNGGFSLRSVALTRHVAAHSLEFPIIHPEDHYLCRVNGPKLKKLGFRFADEETAQRFSFELGKPHPEGSFGFHDCRNFPYVLSKEKIEERLKLETEYLTTKVPWVILKSGGTWDHLEPNK